jgi:hypothetical protein
MISPVFPRSHVSELCDNETCFMCTTLNTGANYIVKAAKYKIREGCMSVVVIHRVKLFTSYHVVETASK